MCTIDGRLVYMRTHNLVVDGEPQDAAALEYLADCLKQQAFALRSGEALS